MVIELGRDEISRIVKDDDTGIVYRLTECCGASGKGSDAPPTYVVCRSCYQPVDFEFGDVLDESKLVLS